MRSATGPTSEATRLRISSAALLVKVMARMAKGDRPFLAHQPGDAVRSAPVSCPTRRRQ